MAVSTKRLEVRPSAGNGQPASAISPALALYAAALNRAQPLGSVSTGDLDEDTAQVHACAVAKGSTVDASSFGLQVTLRPHDYHTVDPGDPTVWTPSAANKVAVMYEAVVTGGGTQYFSVTAL